MWRYVLFLVGLIIHLVLSEKCPPKNAVAPCECDDETSDIMVHCRRLTKAQDFEKAMRSLKNIYVQDLRIIDSNIAGIANDLFVGMQIEEIDVMRSTLYYQNPTNPVLTGLETSLVGLNIERSYRDKPVVSMTMGHLKALRYLTVESNNIPVIRNEFFQSGPTSLTELHLTVNRIEKIEDQAFKSLSSVQYLKINQNRKLTTLTRSMFPRPAPSLYQIALDRNGISSLPADMFVDMPRLKEIDLYDNHFTTISETVFSPVFDNLDSLDLYGNPLVCDKKIKWIYEAKESLWFRVKAVCDAPSHLKDRNLELIDPNDLE